MMQRIRNQHVLKHETKKDKNETEKRYLKNNKTYLSVGRKSLSTFEIECLSLQHQTSNDLLHPFHILRLNLGLIKALMMKHQGHPYLTSDLGCTSEEPTQQCSSERSKTKAATDAWQHLGCLETDCHGCLFCCQLSIPEQ